MPMARSKMPKTPYIVQLFGLENALLQAIFVLWISLLLGLIVLSSVNVLKSPITVIMAYACVTLLLTLFTSFQASCLSKGGCHKTALLTVVFGNIALVGSALALH